jgi:arylsulfatase A-like enzyme
MAREGLKLVDFYTAHSVCTPARAALMTGRYAPRVGIFNKNPCKVLS